MEKMEKPTVEAIPDTEDTLGVLDEYTQKLLEAIQQEKKRVREQALQESSSIIAQAGEKARQIYEKAIKDAEEESAAILAESKVLAGLIIGEAERFTKAVAELKQSAEQEIEEASVKVRQEADVIAEAIGRGEKTIGDAKDELQKEFKESARVVTEIKQKLKQVTKASENKTKKESTPLDEPVESSMGIINDGEEVAEPTGAEAQGSSSNGSDDQPFLGTLALDVSPGGSELSERFQKRLSKIPNLDVSLVDNSAKEKTRITVFVNKPLPLLSILNELALVKSAVADIESIRVILDKSDPWRG
jgi:F0F1-type ATP synthase membrane subunit b/b'